MSVLYPSPESPRAPQEIERHIHKECQKLVEDLIFYLLTTPTDWRYSRDSDWEIGRADNLKNFIKQNAAYLFNNMQDTDNVAKFTVTEDNEDEYYEAEQEIFSVLNDMFPTIQCLHGDDRDDILAKFVPRLRKLQAMFS